MFALGLITGIALCTFIAILFVRYKPQVDKVVEVTTQTFDTVSHAEIIKPKTPDERAVDRLMEANEKKGLLTRLSDIL